MLAPRRGEKILDLCSGTGRVASWIAQAVGEEGEVVGMDISKSMVEVAKKTVRGTKESDFSPQRCDQTVGISKLF